MSATQPTPASRENGSAMTVALVPIARTTFDIALAEEMTHRVRSRLQTTDFKLTGPDSLVTTLEDAGQVATNLASDPPDLLLILQSTFADSTMIMELARAVNSPLLMWAIPEQHTGGRLRLNSLCGINLAGLDPCWTAVRDNLRGSRQSRSYDENPRVSVGQPG